MRTALCSVTLIFFLLGLSVLPRVCVAGRVDSLAPIHFLLLGERVSNLTIPQLADHYAAWAENRVAAADRSALLARVSAFPSGGATPYFSGSVDSPEIVIPSRGAAFYILGAMAVTGQSRTAALWCFAEAARRNPESVMFLNNFGFMLMEFEQFRAARKVLEYVVTHSPHFLSARVNLAMAQGAMRDFSASGDNLHQAVSLFPRQPDYYALGAQAYHLAGQDSAAWSLASLGKMYHGVSIDFDSIISDLKYPAASGQCEMPLSCFWNSACLDFMVSGSSQPLIDAKDWENTYIANTLDPAYVRVSGLRQQCIQAVQDKLQLCMATTPQPLVAICHCRSWVEEAYCDITYEQAIFGNEAVFHGALYGRYLMAQGQTQTGLNAISASLQAGENPYLQCKVLEDFALILDGVAEDERNTLSAQMQYILIARSNLNTVVSACNQHFSSFEHWLYTSGTSFNAEPAFCYGPVCVSFDATGKVAASFAFGPAIKLSYDPMKENWGFAIGVGVQFGAGPWAAGGAVVFKADDTSRGIAVSGGALYASAEQFFGFQRIPVKVTYY